MESKKYEMELAGKTLTAEFTDLTSQANGSVIVKYGNTAVLATAVMGVADKDSDYFPLTVDYEEKFYASGMIRGSQYVRREGRPGDDSILRGRIVDRTLRPLFDHHIRRDVQIVITTLAIDEHDPDVFAVIAASLATATSDIPWNGPVGALRIARKKGSKEWIINPTFAERPEDQLDFDMVVCGKDGLINMIEVEAGEISEKETVEALQTASKYITEIENFQKKIIEEIGKEKQHFPKPQMTEEEIAHFNEVVAPNLDKAVFSGSGKKEIYALHDQYEADYALKFPEGKWALAELYFEEAINNHLHKETIENNRRPDGRGLDQLRSLFAKAGGISEVLHGSGIFYRGETHMFTALTLGGPQDSQTIDMIDGGERKKRFMHHYNFPPYSVGEVGKMGGTNRRMVGHGALAEKSIRGVIPTKEKFPYTIRLVSETLSSNGSSSMGSVCASTLALMDGGVPITRPVAGIAMGAMIDEEANNIESAKYKILTDIQGPEDEHGDMDFKVAGTTEGITGVQLDVKVSGIPIKILSEAFEQSKKARLEIIDVLVGAIATPREKISPRAPEIIITKVKPDQIGLVIGSGGKTINEIRELTNTEIEIEDDGTVYITGKNGGASQAKKIIDDMTREYIRGEKFQGIVIKIMDFGAFVKIGHNTEGLVHISEIAPFRVEKVGNILQEGMTVPVIVKEVDDKGRINLSIKGADPQFAERHGAKPTPNTQQNGGEITK
jgi:polyribonucleotide nucleotidyltransferase